LSTIVQSTIPKIPFAIAHKIAALQKCNFAHLHTGISTINRSRYSKFTQIEKVKNKLKLKELNNVQLEVLHDPVDWYRNTVLALIKPVTLVIEPVVAIITDQVNMLTSKVYILWHWMGRAAGGRFVTRASDNISQLALCTPDYLFGT